MYGLTRRQRIALASVLALLLVGWAVRAWRLAHPEMNGGNGARATVPVIFCRLAYAHTEF